MLNQLLKNRIICRIIDLSCRIISLENTAEFPIFHRTLSEALTRELVPIDQQINNLLQQQIKRNCEILESLFKTIIFCGKNNIALRGPQDDDPQNASPSGNFQALLAFRIDSSEKTLQHHLETVPTNTTYIS